MDSNITNRVYRIKCLMQKFAEKKLSREEEIELYTFALGNRQKAEEIISEQGKCRAGMSAR